MKITIKEFNTVTSTQKIARESDTRPDEILVVKADQQTSGYGRMGRKWYSPSGGNLYFSFVYYPQTSKNYYPLHSLVIGVALIQALEKYQIQAYLKWPNDVFVDDQKISGIICESIKDKLIIGMGLNYYLSEEAKEQINRPAISLSEIIENLPEHLELIQVILNNFLRLVSFIGKNDLLENLFFQYCYKKGQYIQFNDGNQIHQIIMKGISSTGSLLGENHAGEVCEFNSGEIIFSD